MPRTPRHHHHHHPHLPSSPAYHANAVEWDASHGRGRYFQFDNFAVPSSPFGLFSYWLNLPSDFYYGDFVITDKNPFCDFQFEAPVHLGFFTIGVDLWESPTINNQFNFHSSIPFVAGWHHVLIGFDTDHDAGQKIGKITIDGVPRVISALDSAPAFSVGWGGNPTDIVTGVPLGGAPPDKFSAAEIYGAPGQYDDVSDPAVIAKFFASGKPVYLGANGELPTGTAPAILFTGTAAAYTNTGTAGPVTEVTEVDPSGGTVLFTDAPNSPSD